MVVGQEYTDFDKGLDDGIEGDIFGFNFLLKSASGDTALKSLFPSNFEAKDTLDDFEQASRDSVVPKESFGNELPVLGYFNHQINRKSKYLFDRMIGMMLRFFESNRSHSVANRRTPAYYHNSHENRPHTLNMPIKSNSNQRFYSLNSLNSNQANSERELVVSKPLGLLLVELSYNNCALGRGSPLVHHKLLISWTKSPVRVFGGAIWKSITPFCTKK